MVGHYHTVIETLELGNMTGWFGLQLFEIDHVGQILSECAGWMSARRERSAIREVFLQHIDAMLNAYGAIPSSEIAQCACLQKLTVYNDWHRHNMLASGGRISGLIDYDSIVEAPKIVDFQNALTYILISKHEPDRNLISPFTESYHTMVALSPLEVSLIYPVMLDRVAWLIADIVDQVRREGVSRRERLAIRLIRLCAWLSDCRDRLTNDLMISSRRRIGHS